MPAHSTSKYPADWEKRRRTVFKEDDWECHGCGHVPDDRSPSGLHAHHVVPISEGGGHGLKNLMTLCKDCHHAVHASDQSGPKLTPRETYECVACEDEFVAGHDFKGSFCSERCWTHHEAEKALNTVRYDDRVCSTCFARFPWDADVCPNCGNWERDVDRRDTLDGVDVDVETLVAALIAHDRLDPD